MMWMVCLLTGPVRADTTVVTFASNGYTYDNGHTRFFFLPDTTCRLEVALRGAHKGARVTLDGEGVVRKAAADGKVGAFAMNGGQYHFIDVDGPAEAITVSGPVRCNVSQYRGAPATHLSYPLPKDSVAEWFYSEISVPSGAEPNNAYYMVDGFSGGYFGIQVNRPGVRHILFSIWSNYNTNDPKEIPSDYAVTLVRKGEDVTTNPFGNEGSGGQSYWNFLWKPETVYRLLVHAEPKGDHTLYSAWFFAPERGAWKFIATWDKARTGGKCLSGLYSFVENFGDNGNDFFKARYGNQWVRTATGHWIELTQARFTTTASPKVHQRYDWGGGADGAWFYQFSGGFKEVGNVHNGSLLTRQGGGVPPDVDLAALPDGRD